MNEFQKVNHVIDTNKEKFNELSELRKKEVDRQLVDLLSSTRNCNRSLQ